jgi:hypothetical protein
LLLLVATLLYLSCCVRIGNALHSHLLLEPANHLHHAQRPLLLGTHHPNFDSSLGKASRFRGGIKIVKVIPLLDTGSCTEVRIGTNVESNTALDREPCMFVKPCIPSISIVWHPIPCTRSTPRIQPRFTASFAQLVRLLRTSHSSSLPTNCFSHKQVYR